MSKLSNTSVQIKQLHKSPYVPPKLQQCKTHDLHKELFCLRESCSNYMKLSCKECLPCRFEQHPCMLVGEIVPRLLAWVAGEGRVYSKEQKEADHEWNTCLINVDYCIRILKEVRKQIEDRLSHQDLRGHHEVLLQVQTMMQQEGQKVAESLVKKFKQLQTSYRILDIDQRKQSYTDEQLSSKIMVAKRANAKTKKFSQKALAFSQLLAELVEQKVKCEKRKNKLADLSAKRIFCLRDILNVQEKETLDQVDNLAIEMAKDKAEALQFYQLLEKCKNLKTLQVNNRNKLIGSEGWSQIADKMEDFKLLKELILNVTNDDLPILADIFEKKTHALRQVETFHLTVTDQIQIDIDAVIRCCNALQLRNLHLTLTRSHLTKEQVMKLIRSLRLSTSMTNLPLLSLHLIVSKNNIVTGNDLKQVQNFFHRTAKTVKIRSIQL